MSYYDPLQAGWRVPCPVEDRSVVVSLAAFRHIHQLPGPARPPAYLISYSCSLCSHRHRGVLSQHQLDVAPCTELFPPHYDLSSGIMDWEAGGLGALWAESIRRGYWPIHVFCQTEERIIGAWPSVIHRIEPDRELQASRYMVSYTCPSCTSLGCEEWEPHRLTLRPHTDLSR